MWEYHVGTTGAHDGPLVKNRHPAKFPYGLPEDHILSWTIPGDTVLDPMAGSGMTLLAAKNTGRCWIGVDISEDYCAQMRTLLGV